MTVQRLFVSALLIGAALPTVAQQRFIVEREIPGAAQMTPEQLAGAAQKSNAVLRSLGPDIQWVQSYVAGDRIYCVYQAPSAGTLRRHAARAGLPASEVLSVADVVLRWRMPRGRSQPPARFRRWLPCGSSIGSTRSAPSQLGCAGS